MKEKHTNWAKVFRLLITIIILCVVVALSYFTYNTRGYWITWFETKQQKLELRDEKSVDSLLNVISQQQEIINNHEEYFSEKYTYTIDSLIDIVNRQNVTIADNKKAIQQYRTVTDNQNKLINQ